MTDLIDKLDELASKAAQTNSNTNHGLFHWLAFAKEAQKSWPAISQRLRAAEAVCEAAGAGISDVNYSIEHNA